jgi:hypothetical protein
MSKLSEKHVLFLSGRTENPMQHCLAWPSQAIGNDFLDISPAFYNDSLQTLSLI